MMKRVAIASIQQESNTFSPVATRYADFAPVFGEDVLTKHEGKLTETGGFISALRERKIKPVPVCAAWAITAGRMVKADFAKLMRGFRKSLIAAGRVDGLLMAMHGAQTAEGVDDVEGHVLGIAREVLGDDVPIVLTLDLHANVTSAMATLANAIVGYHTYPHVDMFETGCKAAQILFDLGAGAEFHMAFRKLPLIVNAENSQTTSEGPFASLMHAAEEMEAAGHARAVSLFPVQPWLDIQEMGCAVTVVSEDRAEAEAAAGFLARQFWESRRDFEPELLSVPEALERAHAIDGGPVVLSESADSTGSGSPGDSSGLLKHLLKADLDGPAAIFLVDPPAVEQAFAAGVGAKLAFRLGGHYDRVHSKPVAVRGTVRMLSDGRWTPRARGYNPGIAQSMGRACVIECGQVQILVAERSTMTVDPALFRSHGIDPLYCKIVAVKSPNGFRAAYEPIAKAMFLVDTPGVSTARLARLPWKNVSRPIYPLDAI